MYLFISLSILKIKKCGDVGIWTPINRFLRVHCLLRLITPNTGADYNNQAVPILTLTKWFIRRPQLLKIEDFEYLNITCILYTDRFLQKRTFVSPVL